MMRTLLLIPLIVGPIQHSIATAPGITCRFDTAAHRDTAQFSLYLAPPLFEANAPASAYLPYIMAVASTFEMPPQITLGSWPGTLGDSDQPCDKDQWCDIGAWDGEVELVLNDRGRLGKLNWTLWPDTPEIRSALEVSVRRADSLKLLAPIPKGSKLRRNQIRLSLRFIRDSAIDGATVLGRFRLPYVAVTKSVGVITQPTPEWPPNVSGRGTGVIQLQYIVAEDGRVSSESIRVLQADYRPFVRPAIQAILDSRFRPAQVDSCPVKLLVRQRVVYRGM
jgi:hypothetical protein